LEGEKMMKDMKNNYRKKRNQKGNALIYAVLVMPVFIGFAGLVIDYGRGVWTKTRLQRAADSGALTGAGYLPSESLAAEKATAIVHENFDTPSLDSEVYVPMVNHYQVELTTTIPTFFMRIFGNNSIEIYAEAIADTNVTVGGLRGGAFPFAIINPSLNNDPSDDLMPSNFGRKYVIGYGEDNVIVGDWANGSAPVPDPNDGNGRGWRGALDLNDDGTLGNAGASDLKNNIIDGWPGNMAAGNTIPAQTGNMTSLDQARDEMLGTNPLPYDDFDPHHNAGCSRVVFVPIIHLINESRQDTYTVQDYSNGAQWDHTNVVVDGFAPFFILTVNEQGDVDGDGHSKDRDWITGYYIPPVTINNYLPPNEYTENFGLYASPRLSH
jgi:hypothetical protein